MTLLRTTRTAVAAAFFGCTLLCAARPVLAQVSAIGEKQTGENVGDEKPAILDKIGITQKLDQQLPMDAQFVDDQGKTVRLGDYFGQHPAIVSMVYYNCPILCSEELDGLTSALEMVRLVPGKDFSVVVISIDPSETPELAARRKAFYLKRYGHPETAAGWHFLTGQKPAIDAVSNAIGFGYVRVPGPDGTLTQFAHASSIEVVTTAGKVAQYYLGVEYSPKDVCSASSRLPATRSARRSPTSSPTATTTIPARTSTR